MGIDKIELYRGFEQGPIRPPSEADSLLIRVTRNCPWNHCTFCPVYKGQRFSIRPVDHVKQDIDRVAVYAEPLRHAGNDGAIDRDRLRFLHSRAKIEDPSAFQAAIHWAGTGMRSVFLQDANSLVIKPDRIVDILTHLRKRFPWVTRVTSYARSHTLSRMSDADLKAIREAGLDRIHVGMESGSDTVLSRVRKGCTKAMHITAGIKVRQAGMELSEYVMPGLGGRDLSEEHALETADALNLINPEFIRLRTLAVPRHVPLFESSQNGEFHKAGDRMTAEEIRLFIENLTGIASAVKSDHILNLFQEVEGVLPNDKEAMLRPLTVFLRMSAEEQCVYQVGRRLGIFQTLSDMENPRRYRKASAVCRENSVTPDNVDAIVDQLMNRFI